MVDDLAEMRWEKANAASDLPAVDALRRAIAEHESGALSLKHAIVVYASDPEKGKESDGVGFFQAGEYRLVHQIGLLEYAKGALLANLLEMQE